MYVGNGTARTVKKGYIGDANGKARLFYNSEYTWERYLLTYTEKTLRRYHDIDNLAGGFNDTGNVYYTDGAAPNIVNGMYSFTEYEHLSEIGSLLRFGEGDYFSIVQESDTVYKCTSGFGHIERANNTIDYIIDISYGYLALIELNPEQGEFDSYVYSTNISQYPENGIQDGYWYVKVSE